MQLPQPHSSDEDDKFSDYEKHKIPRVKRPAQSAKVLVEQHSESEDDTFITIQKKKIKKNK